MARQSISLPTTGRTLNAAWARGMVLKTAEGRTRRDMPPFEGWFLDAGVDPAFDDAAAQVGWQRAHKANMQATLTEVWLVPSPTAIFIAINGLPEIPAGEVAERMVLPMAGAWQQVAKLGIKARWPEGGRSRLAVQGILADLVPVGYTTPIPFTVSSNYTKDLATVLYAHNAALDAAEAAAAAAGRSRTFEFWDVAIVMEPGEPEMRGGGVEKAEAVPPVSVPLPFRDGEPDLDALRARVRQSYEKPFQKDAIAAAVTAHWGSIVAWAQKPEYEARPA
jgi:hypothetical protein